jgi:hypothetical protein
MSLVLRTKLLSLLPKLFILSTSKLNDLLKEFPEASTRSALLILYDDRGKKIGVWLGFENNKPVVRGVDPKNPPYATNEISMHIDVFIKIIKGQLDFRSAYLYDLIDIKSNDGLPETYHLLLWSAYFDKLVEILKK